MVLPRNIVSIVRIKKIDKITAISESVSLKPFFMIKRSKGEKIRVIKIEIKIGFIYSFAFDIAPIMMITEAIIKKISLAFSRLI
jgi:hypothetical protein